MGRGRTGAPVGLLLALTLAVAPGGCSPDAHPVVIGRPGLNPGEFSTPRGIDARNGRIAVVDKSGRVQVFLCDGTFQREFRCMPEDAVRGFPLDVRLDGADGSLWVAHTHRGQIVHYDAGGHEDRLVGDYGMAPGEFCMPQRLVAVDDGWVVSDFGYRECRRLHRFTAAWQFLGTVGGPATPLEFHRPMGMARTTDADGTEVLWVADANHRLVRIVGGVMRDVVGARGEETGSLIFPTGVAAHPDGGVVVCEAGNHRIQWFGEDGLSRGVFGAPGSEPGQFKGPYDLAVDDGWVWIADTDNHRVQGFRLADITWQKGKESP